MTPPRNLEIARRLVIEELVRAELATLTPRERRRLRMQMTDKRREVVQAPAYTTLIGEGSWEIAENLHRKELESQERADDILRWVEVLKARAVAAPAAPATKPKGAAPDLPYRLESVCPGRRNQIGMVVNPVTPNRRGA